MSQFAEIGLLCATSSMPPHAAGSPASQSGLPARSGRTQFGSGPGAYVRRPRKGSTPERSPTPKKPHVLSVSSL
jgi:hypothetical protein